jgi:hypothetical protein
MMSLGGLDPELVAQIQTLVGTDPSHGDTASAWTPPSAAPPDDGTTVMDTISGILTSPFRLIGAAKRGIEDAVGHPNAIARDQQDAQYDMTLKYLLASDAIPDDVKRMLPLPQTDRSGYVARQISTSPTAVGRDNSTLPVPTPRRPGVLEWLTGEDRRQRARDQATIAAAMKLAGLDYDFQKDRADIRQKMAAGNASQANALKTDYETQLLYRYGDRKNQADIDQSVASALSSRASAANSAASMNATNDRNSRENEYYETVRLPGGIQTNTQREQMHDMRLRTGEERLRQLTQMGPLNVQAKQATIARQGGAGEIPRDAVSALKGIGVAVNQARDDATKNAGVWGKVFGVDEKAAADGVYDQWLVPRKDDGSPDWEGFVGKFHAKPTAAVPSTNTISTKPTGAERFKVYDLLKKKFPGLDDGVLSSRADLISEAMPHLNFTSEDAFLDSAELAGLNDEEMVAVWNNRNQ